MPNVKCKICETEFYIKPSHQKLGWGKYCSNICRTKSQFNGKGVKCYICNKDVYRSNAKLKRSRSGKYFCTKKCQTLWRNSIYIEDRSSNWINGNKSYRKIMSRRDLLSKCFRCNITDIRVLVIHHVDHDRTNNAINNLKCICQNCHFLVHHYKDIDEELKNDNK